MGRDCRGVPRLKLLNQLNLFAISRLWDFIKKFRNQILSEQISGFQLKNLGFRKRLSSFFTSF